MKKKAIVVLLVSLGIVLAAGVGLSVYYGQQGGSLMSAVCSHNWAEATCWDPKICQKCDLIEGEKLSHIWVDATCTTPKTCSACSATEGEKRGHSWVDANCTTPKTCSVCALTEGTIKHSWVDANCTNPKTCTVCALTEGDVKHNWVEATCTTPKTCSSCALTEGEAKGHVWVAANCTTPKTCSLCGVTDGNASGHKWNDPTCTTPKACSLCGVTEGNTSGHEWNDPTCTTPKVCSLCGVTEGDASGHEWNDPTCTTPKVCSLCGVTEGDASGHKWKDSSHTGAMFCLACGQRYRCSCGYACETCNPFLNNLCIHYSNHWKSHKEGCPHNYSGNHSNYEYLDHDYHGLKCLYCEVIAVQELHIWVAVGTTYKCDGCSAVSSYPPSPPETEEPISVTGVTISKTSMELYVGDSDVISATVSPSNAANKSVSWTSSNNAVATVSATGKITAKGVGFATITITTVDGSYTAKCTVTVAASPGTESGADVLIISKAQMISNQTIDTDVYITSTGVAPFNNVTVNGNIYCYGQLQCSGCAANNVYAYAYGSMIHCGAFDGVHGKVSGGIHCNDMTILDNALDYAFNKWGKR